MILIVDDHWAVRAALGELLRAAFPGQEVCEAPDGTTALACLRGRGPGVVVMDIQLPDADGILLIGVIRRLTGNLVIVVSQHAPGIYEPRAQAAGAFAFVPKDRLHVDAVPTVARALRALEGGRVQ